MATVRYCIICGQEIGASPRDASLDIAEHAAWTVVANVIMNLDEFLTKG